MDVTDRLLPLFFTGKSVSPVVIRRAALLIDGEEATPRVPVSCDCAMIDVDDSLGVRVTLHKPVSFTASRSGWASIGFYENDSDPMIFLLNVGGLAEGEDARLDP